MFSIKQWLLAGIFFTLSQSVLAVVINEIRIDQPGSDLDEYFELAGIANESLDNLTYLVIGDGAGGSGSIEAVIPLQGLALEANGFFTVSENSFTLANSHHNSNLNFENSDNVTHMLVADFSGNNGDDLDINDDGVLDFKPWSSIIDSVALIESHTFGEKVYSNTVIGPDGNFVPAHIYRQDDIQGVWVIGTFDPIGGNDTPGYSNSSTPPPPPPTQSLSISEIQGAGHISPYEGQLVQTEGIVTAVTGNGFYLQNELGDGNPATSDAIFVFTGSTPQILAGDKISLSALVDEFIPGGASTQNLSITELINADITLLGSGFSVSATIIGENYLLPPTENVDDDALALYQPTTDAIDFYESLEAMLLTVKDSHAISPLNRFNEVYVLAEHGDFASGINSRGGITLKSDDYNPERIQIQVDSNLTANFTPEINTGNYLGDVTGVLSYSFGNFEIRATTPFTVIPGSLQHEITAIQTNKSKLTVASYNVLNLDPNGLYRHCRWPVCAAG